MVLLEPAGDLGELGGGLGEVVGQVVDRLRRPVAGDDVLALGVDEVVALEAGLRRCCRSGDINTPVPDSSPVLPNTIATTTTAVPRSWAMPAALR